VFDGRTGLQILAPAECWRLLASQRFGRVGFVADGEPLILPVNYAVDRRSIVFRTAGGTKLDAVTSWPSVAFEIDGVDDERGPWSVLVTGRGERLRDPQAVAAAEALGVRPWAPGGKLHWISIAARRVSGRRLPVRDGREVTSIPTASSRDG
jgi:nitroimidazol reductase NimA-like FMN-containing flavoprotein (pyridoxamine 5'-phosphate oxidase superfamily)